MLKTAQARSGAPHFHARPGARSGARANFSLCRGTYLPKFGVSSEYPPPPDSVLNVLTQEIYYSALLTSTVSNIVFNNILIVQFSYESTYMYLIQNRTSRQRLFTTIMQRNHWLEVTELISVWRMYCTIKNLVLMSECSPSHLPAECLHVDSIATVQCIPIKRKPVLSVRYLHCHARFNQTICVIIKGIFSSFIWYQTHDVISMHEWKGTI